MDHVRLKWWQWIFVFGQIAWIIAVCEVKNIIKMIRKKVRG